ncbi:MAG: HD domain-containing protein [Chloroflexaceae bacterium]|nr:HD domain-containing protein [Chloroflexaceae bacterium]
MYESSAAPIVALYGRLLALKLLPRTGWLQRGQAAPESVAEHTFGVASLALLVSEQIPDLDRGKLLALALVHDMAEALFGDLPIGARRYFGAEAKHEAERRAMQELLAGLPDPDCATYLALWDEYASRNSREARLIKQLDRLEMLVQALAYKRAGNQAMVEFWEDIDDGWSAEFPLVAAMAAELRAQIMTV